MVRMQAFIKYVRLFLFLLLFFVHSGNTNAAFNASDKNKNLFFKTNDDIKVRLKVKNSDIKTFNKVLEYIKKYNWIDAFSWADSIESEHLKDAMVDYVLWKKYSQLSYSGADLEFSDFLEFIPTHLYLPNIKDLRMKAEQIYTGKNIPYQFVEEYFKKVKPLTARAMIKNLLNKPITASDVINALLDYSFENDEMSYFISKFGMYLTEANYATKVGKLLWDKEYQKAIFLMNKLNHDNRLLYAAIIDMNKNPKNIDNALKAIPWHLRNNELLLYTKFINYHKTKNTQKALAILLSLNELQIKRPDKWWVYRNYYARELINSKDYKNAYTLVNKHGFKTRVDNYHEAEWMAGWIALTFLHDAKTGYTHFVKMYNSVGHPVYKSKAAYWAGRALESLGNKKEATGWYEIGARYPIYFYGQLAFYERNSLLNVPKSKQKNPLPSPPIFTKEEENRAIGSDIVKIAYIMEKCDDNPDDYTSLFRSAINLARTKGERSAIFEVIKNTGNEALITKMAKYLANKNIYFIDNLFPVLHMVNLKNSDSILIHAIIKQESGFHVLAESSSGAIGFMQLMPDTAKGVAKKLGIKYNEKSLRTNPEYNILLGSYYINSLIKQYNGSQVLAIAAYNAGPTATNKWISTHGDPRQMKNTKSIVNWIELIRYKETRDYVQRIIENAVVYEHVLTKIQK